MQSKPDIGAKTRLHLTLDVAMPDGTMPGASMVIEGPTVLVYASMAAAITMFARRLCVRVEAVNYSATWEDVA